MSPHTTSTMLSVKSLLRKAKDAPRSAAAQRSGDASDAVAKAGTPHPAVPESSAKHVTAPISLLNGTTEGSLSYSVERDVIGHVGADREEDDNAALLLLPEVLSPQLEQQLFSFCEGTPSRASATPAAPAPPAKQSGWVLLRGRSVLKFGGDVTERGLENAHSNPLPPCLRELCDKVGARFGFPADKTPNHVLVNKYAPGDGIQPHEDGPLYHPNVVILSLHAMTLFDFSPKQKAPDPAPTAAEPGATPRQHFPPPKRLSVFVPPRSALVLPNSGGTSSVSSLPPGCPVAAGLQASKSPLSSSGFMRVRGHVDFVLAP